MRLVLFIGRLAVGGAERQLVQLAAGLGRRGHEVTVATLFPGGALCAELVDEPVSLVSLSSSPPANRWRSSRALWSAPGRLRALLEARRAEVLYSLLYPPNVIAALAVGKRPRLPWVCGLRASQMKLNPFRMIMFRANARLSGRAAMLVANSVTGLDFHRARGFDARRTTTIFNGIDTERFRPWPDAGKRLRHELGIADEAVVIGRVGRLDPVKDYPTFLAAAARLASSHPACRFLCVGGGPGAVRQQLAADARNLGLDQRVIWAGERNDMPAVYNAMDVAVSSSLGEGFPNVVAEAMACGVPCVATDVGDTARLVGDLGRLIAAGDERELASAIADMMVAAPSSADCRRRIVERFSVERMVTATDAVLKELAVAGP